MEEILTKRFSVAPSVHARLALARRSARFWMALALPLLILVVAGVYYDMRLLYVAAVITFILFPTLLLIAWNSLLTRQSAINGMFPQTVLFSRDEEISVRYYPLENLSETSQTPEPSTNTGRVPPELIIPASDITDCRLYGQYLDLSYAGGNDLLIPLSSLSDPTSTTALLQRFGRPLE